MSKYILPITIIIVEIGAAIDYGIHSEWKMAVYWIAAAVLNVCVTF